MSACASQPSLPDWQLNAKAASDRFVEAELTGRARVAALELARARDAVSATGRADLLARLELLACATRQASLDFSECSGYEALRGQALPAEQAYAAYLTGQLDAAWLPLLPPAQTQVARQLAAGAAPALSDIQEPLSRLVAAAVVLRAGRADEQVLATAIRTASDQGWRKPLLAWLGLAAQRADQAGHAAEAARLRARMALVAPPASAGRTP